MAARGNLSELVAENSDLCSSEPYSRVINNSLRIASKMTCLSNKWSALTFSAVRSFLQGL